MRLSVSRRAGGDLRGGSAVWKANAAGVAARQSFFGYWSSGLSVYASGWRVRQQQVMLNLRASTPIEGDIHEGHGEWHVYVGGVRNAAASAYGILDFGWIGTANHEVKGRFVDRAGNAGEWVTYTFAASGAPTYEVWVDPTGGNNANPGTLASPIATRSEARSRVLANLTSAGQSAIVYLKRGETHGYTGGSGEWWSGDDLAFEHQVQFVAYGTGARPLVQATSSFDASTPFRTGKRGSVHLVGIEIDCVALIQGAGGNTVGVNAQRTGAGIRAPLNLLIDDCVIRNATTGVLIEDETVTSDAVLATGVYDFCAFRDLTVTDVGAWHMFESTGLRNVHRERVTFSRQIPLNVGLRNTDRVSCWTRSYMREMVWDTRGTDGVNGSVRFQSGGSTGGGATTWRYASYLDCEYFGTDQSLAKVGMGRKAPDDAFTSVIADVRWLNLRTNSAAVSIGGGTSSGPVVDRVQYWNCTVGGSFELGITGAGGIINSVEVRNCATTQSGSFALAHIRLSSNSAARYAAGSITVTGHVGLHPSTVGNQALYYAQYLEQAQLVSIINEASRKNHSARHGDGFAPTWAFGGFSAPATVSFDLNLAAWKAARSNDGGDLGSTATTNSTLNIVNVGTSAANLTDFDPHYLDGTGPLDGLGESRIYSIDGDGFIRPLPNDPGPFHFGASANPSLPPGGSGATATGSATISIFGAASATQPASAQGAGLIRLQGQASATQPSSAAGSAAFGLLGQSVATQPSSVQGSATIDLFGQASATQPVNAQGSSTIGLFGQASATQPSNAQGLAVFGLRGEASGSAGAAITRLANGQAFIQLSGQASAEAFTTPPPFGCQIKNTSASRFVGWWHVNTDLQISEAFGQRSGTTFVRGEASGLDTRMVSVLVDLDPGETLTLADFVAETTNPPPAAGSDPGLGSPTIGGVAMIQHGPAIMDGAATVTEWRLRSGVWMIYLWTTQVMGEPWAICKVVIAHSNPTTPSLRENWPGWVLAWAGGTVQALGRGADGTLVASGRGFGDGQAQPRPVLVWWPSLYRVGFEAQDAASVEALRGGGVMGHAIQNLLNDGTPLERTATASWAAGAIAGAIARLDTWDESPNGIRKQAGPPGNQADHMFVREEPRYYVDATLAVYIEACRWGAKPCHHLELDGRYIDLITRTNLRLFDGRPHPPTTSDQPGQPGSGMLGKPGPITPSVHTETWDGPGIEHKLTNGLAAAVRYTGCRALQWVQGAWANLYLGSRFPTPAFGSNSAIFATRGLMIEAANGVHFYRELRDRALANRIRDRIRERTISGIWTSWINPTHGFPAEYWQVFTFTTASIPFAPGYIPWQQGPCAYFLDLADRVIGGLSALRSAIEAGAYQVLEDVWQYEFSPSFGVDRWVEYEQQELPKPFGLGRRGRDGTWATAWLPPVIALIRRIDPGNAKANEIWAQMLAQLGGGGTWMPPSEAVAGLPDTAQAAGLLNLYGAASASSANAPNAGAGFASLGIAGQANAELGAAVPFAIGQGLFSIAGEASATDDDGTNSPAPTRRLRRPYWIWMLRRFRI